MCNSCPVPALLLTSSCSGLTLEVEVKRRLFSDRVEVAFCICSKHLVELEDPRHCPDCAREAGV